MFFFFQAEDGIRDLVRSRGLGDVYKRQPPEVTITEGLGVVVALLVLFLTFGSALAAGIPLPVSYTHLTLPTSDLV